MPSKAEQVAARVVVVLAGASTGALAVYRDRQDPLTHDETPVILVELVGDDSTVLSNDYDRDMLSLRVCICVRSATWQTIADAVRTAAHAALMQDATLQTLLGVSLRRDRADWRAADTDLPYGQCSQLYKCQYLTRTKGLDL
jgi:hypothetical protein